MRRLQRLRQGLRVQSLPVRRLRRLRRLLRDMGSLPVVLSRDAF